MYVRRVVVGVSGSPGSLEALRYAAGMARGQGAALSPVHAWTPPGGEGADRRCPNPYLRAVWKQAAWDRLWRAIELALGGPPDDIEFSPEVVRGQPGDVLSHLAQPGDVMVVGAGRHAVIAAHGRPGQQVLPGARALPCNCRAASPAGNRGARTAWLGIATSNAP